MRWNREKAWTAAAGVLVLALFVVVVVNSTAWLGRTFPGFMVMANRVVPSIALPHWSEGRAPELFQNEVLAVDGTPVSSARQVYALAAAGAGTPIRYELRSPAGRTWELSTHAQVFTWWDYSSLFGAYLLNGLIFCAIGLLVIWLEPRRPASQGLCVAALGTGIFVTTAADLYGPYWFFRLHVAAEVLMAAGFAHLALVFPSDRLGRRRTPVLAVLYALTAALILAYESVLWIPAWYTTAHLVAVSAQVLACLGMISAFVYDYVRSDSALVRRRIQMVTLGVIAGMLAPAAVWAMSAVLGGQVSMNWAALTAFLFPLSFAYAVIQQDLFEIDAVVRRATTYAVVVVLMVTAYVTVLSGASWLLDTRGGIAEHPTVLVALNVVLLLTLSPLRIRTQLLIDGLFFRRKYDPQATVERFGHALESSLRTSQVVDETRRALREALWPRRLTLFDCDGPTLVPFPGQEESHEVRVPAELFSRLGAGEVLTRYGWGDQEGRVLPSLWEESGAEILVPVLHDETLDAVVALGRKESGRAYNVHDSALLRTMAGQISLALATARAFGELEELNRGLEQQVELRTSELAEANEGLRASLARLNETYAQLEQNQTSLVRADRLATLGRLAAGIAHEVNTPLGAVLNSLDVLRGLGQEYRESIADDEVTPADHREIANELLQNIENAETWAQRAASYIGRVKSHGRDPGQSEICTFTIGDAVSEIEGLLNHRLRAAGCRIQVDAETKSTSLRGDPSRLAHVLMNIVDNAIGAYEEQEDPDGRIEIWARRDDGCVSLAVRDRAGGIPWDVAGHIFDELFTTKERGKGTGLGLWIARNVVERSYRGSLELLPVDGPGTCLLAKLLDDDGSTGAAPQASTVAEAEPPTSRP